MRKSNLSLEKLTLAIKSPVKPFTIIPIPCVPGALRVVLPKKEEADHFFFALAK